LRGLIISAARVFDAVTYLAVLTAGAISYFLDRRENSVAGHEREARLATILAYVLWIGGTIVFVLTHLLAYLSS